MRCFSCAGDRLNLRVLDLFSGIGGFSLGLERAGFQTVAFCEVDPYCRAVLAKHWPLVPCFGDVRTLDKRQLEGLLPIDVICGGFPCQDISISGEGAGLDGERSGLWVEFARLIGELRPRYAIVENVAAITFRGLLDVLGDFAEMGFSAEWRAIPASAVGAPHQRERIWIVAYAAGVGLPPAWECFKSGLDTKGAFKETDGLVAAVQKGAVPYVCGRHDGLSRRLDECAIAALGNSVVPQIPEIIGRAILEAERHASTRSKTAKAIAEE